MPLQPGTNVAVLTVLTVALVWGADAGMLTGAAAGLLLAMVPGAGEPVGLWALALTVVGYAVGGALGGEDLSRRRVALICAAAGAGSTASVAVLSLLLGAGGPGPLGLLVSLTAQALYCAALGALLVPLAGRFLEAAPARW